MTITITRLFPSGAWDCSAIHAGRLIRKVFFGYSKREARAEFLADLKDL